MRILMRGGDIEKAQTGKDKKGDGELYWLPLASLFLAFALLWSPLEFETSWALLQLFGVLTNAESQMAFYRWWISSDTTGTELRGFSTYGYPLFGVIPMPALPPLVLHVVTYAYAASLGAMALTSGSVRYGCTVVAALLSLPYFASLWAERAASYHREAMTLTIFMYLVVGADPAYAQFHIASVYFVSGVQKVLCSIANGMWWAHYAPHLFMWKAMWSKPYFPAVQRLLFTHPWLMAIGGNATLLADFSALFLLFLSPSFPALATLRYALVTTLLCFHGMVLIAQGIDYLTFWAPALLIFAKYLPPPSSDALPLWSTALWDSLDWQTPAGLLLLFQLGYALTLAEAWNINIPPFTSCPMFVTVAPINCKSPQHYVVSAEQHSSIKFERLEWMMPYIRPGYALDLPPSDVDKIPFKFVSFGYMVHARDLPAILRHWIVYPKEGPYFVTNDPERLTPELRERISTLMTNLHDPKSTYDPYADLDGLCDEFRAITNAINYN